MNPAYQPLLDRLSTRFACSRHFRPEPGWKLSDDCQFCLQEVIGHQSSRLIAGLEQLLKAVADDDNDARHQADNEE